MNNVSIFDGPPEQRADLIGEGMDAHGMWRWDATHIDPYLVCRYEDTKKTVTFHAFGVKYGAAGLNPRRACCR